MLKRMNRRQRQVGDTLVEVLFAVTVFSLVVVSTLALMNQGAAASTRSLQITLVRQEIDSQAETLRFLNASYTAAYYNGYAPSTTDTTTSPAEEYYKIVQSIPASVTSVSQFGGGGTTCQTPPARSFVLNSQLGMYQQYDTTKIRPANTFSQVVYAADKSIVAADGLWVEAVRSAPANGTRYTDFHIRACWYPPGTGQAMNLGTIVRLYEPAS